MELVKRKTVVGERCMAAAVLLHVCASLVRFCLGKCGGLYPESGRRKTLNRGEIRSQPGNPECRACLPFTHRCGLSQSRLFWLIRSEEKSQIRIQTNIWSQFAQKIGELRKHSIRSIKFFWLL